MEETKEDVNTVPHQISTVDKDLNRLKNVKELNVAPVALGKSFFFSKLPTLRVE
jgi:hypothetical protein